MSNWNLTLERPLTPELQALIEEVKGIIVTAPRIIPVVTVSLPANVDSSVLLLPGVLSIEPDEPLGAEPLRAQAFNPGYWPDRLIGITEAQTVATGAGIKVGIVDTGIDTTHPEFLGVEFFHQESFVSTEGPEDLAGHGCVHPNARIITSLCGLERIEDVYRLAEGLYGAQADGTVLLPDPVYTLGSRGRTRVRAVHKIRVQDDVCRVVTQHGTVTTTKWHPFLLRHRSGRLYYKRADKLRFVRVAALARSPKPDTVGEGVVGVAVEYRRPSSGLAVHDTIMVDCDVAYMLGLIAADGHLDKTGVKITFGQEAEALTVQPVASQAFGIDVSIRRAGQRTSTWTMYLPQRVKALCQELGFPEGGGRGSKARRLRVPKAIFLSPPDVQMAYFAGVVDGDGHISQKTARLRIVGAGSQFIQDLGYLVNSWGARASTCFAADHRNRRIKSPGIWVLSVGGATLLKSISSALAPHLRLKRIPDGLRTKDTRYRGTSSVLRVGQESYDGFFYDLTTDSDDYLAGEGNLVVVHNTAVAGVVAAQRLQVLGVAPGVSIANLKVLDLSGSAMNSTLVMALDRAVTIGCDVVNLSLALLDRFSMPPSMELALLTLANNGIIVVVAAGNEGTTDILPMPGKSMHTLAVGAVSRAANVPSWSNSAPWPEGPECAGPGVDVPTVWPGGGYALLSGTSLACPFVAGAMALALSISPGLRSLGTAMDPKFDVELPATIVNVRDVLATTSNPLTSLDRSGYGLVDAQAVVGVGQTTVVPGPEPVQISQAGAGLLLIGGGLLVAASLRRKR